MVLRKILCSLFLLIIVSCCANAESIIAPSKTKFNVKIQDSFSTLSVGDYKKISLNLKSLKNKKINWAQLNATADSNIFFTGLVSKVELLKTESGKEFPPIQFDINELVVDGRSYKVNRKIHSILGETVLESLNKNYNIILLKDLTDSDNQLYR